MILLRLGLQRTSVSFKASAPWSWEVMVGRSEVGAQRRILILLSLVKIEIIAANPERPRAALGQVPAQEHVGHAIGRIHDAVQG